MKIIKLVWAKLIGGKLVWLRDYDGEVTLTVAKLNPWGEWIAKRYFPFSIRQVRLMPGGKVSGASYVEDWKWAE